MAKISFQDAIYKIGLKYNSCHDNLGQFCSSGSVVDSNDRHFSLIDSHYGADYSINPAYYGKWKRIGKSDYQSADIDSNTSAIVRTDTGKQIGIVMDRPDTDLDSGELPILAMIYNATGEVRQFSGFQEAVNWLGSL